MRWRAGLLKMATRYIPQKPRNKDAVSKFIRSDIEDKLRILEDEDVTAIHREEDDLEYSVEILDENFITWHRFADPIVKLNQRTVIKNLSRHVEMYANRFRPIHTGSKDSNSYLIGEGSHSKVYHRRGGNAYKIVNVRDDDSLRCNLLELAFFHSLNHNAIMKPVKSQIVMSRGKIRRIIHEMPKVRGTLDHVIKGSELTNFTDFRRVMHGVLSALDYMHSRGIHHGDMKPANVLIDKDFYARLSDFTTTGHDDRGVIAAFGSLYWRAPELVAGNPGDCRSDIWSVGMMVMDILYSTTFMKSIAVVRSNSDCFAKMQEIFGRPSPEWCKKYLIDHSMLFERDSTRVGKRIAQAEIATFIGEKEYEMINWIMEKTLQWDPDDRFTAKQLLRHPMFTDLSLPEVRAQSFVMGDRLEKMSKWVFKWNSDEERARMRTLISIEEEWAADIAAQLTKRVSTTLRHSDCHCNLLYVARMCENMVRFMWLGETIEDVTIESQIYHIFLLVKNKIFLLD